MGRHEIITRARDVLEADGLVRLAVLFGSHSADRPRPGSDVDIAIVPRDPSVSLWDEGNLASRLEEALGRPVDLVRLDLAPTLVQWEVIKNGGLIFADSPADWTRLVARVIAEHADYAPAAARVARTFLRRVAASTS